MSATESLELTLIWKLTPLPLACASSSGVPRPCSSHRTAAEGGSSGGRGATQRLESIQLNHFLEQQTLAGKRQVGAGRIGQKDK